MVHYYTFFASSPSNILCNVPTKNNVRNTPASSALTFRSHNVCTIAYVVREKGMEHKEGQKQVSVEP